MTYRCEHCNFEFESFFRLSLHLSSTVADSLGDVGPMLAPGHPEHMTTVGAHEMWALKMPFEPAKKCEREANGTTCENDAEVFVKWECGACAMTLCAACLIDITRTMQSAARLGVSTLSNCPAGGVHDASRFHQPVAI